MLALLDYLQSLPLPAMFLATLAMGFGVEVFVLLVVRLAARKFGNNSRVFPIRDALISATSAIFALMATFSAAGIWSDAIQARAAVQREANAIENILTLSSVFPEELQAEVVAEMSLYVHRVVQEDWPAMQHRVAIGDPMYNRSDNPLVRLTRAISRYPQGSYPLPVEQVISQIHEVRSARLQREIIALGGVSEVQWLVLALIPVFTLTIIAIAHNHERGLQFSAMTLYALVVCSALFVILAHDRAFVGTISVTPRPIQQALDRALEEREH